MIHTHADDPPFRPAPLARGPHAQTLLGKALRRPPPVRVHSERWDTPDGDEVRVDLGPGADHARLPLALVLHGLEGSSERAYVRLLMAALLERGVATLALNFRGCGGPPNRLPRAYHSGDSEELAWVVDRLRARWPDRLLGAAGFSLGGNVLLKYLGERGAATPLSAAAVASVPLDLDAAERHIDGPGVHRLYRRYFLDSLKAKVAAKAHLLDASLVARVRRAQSLRAFDDLVTAPLHGFRDATDYYRRSSALGFVGGVRVPTLVVQAADDPFLPLPGPPPDLRSNPALALRWTRRGGHLGFLGGSLRRPHWWAEERMAIFLASSLGGSKSSTPIGDRASTPLPPG